MQCSVIQLPQALASQDDNVQVAQFRFVKPERVSSYTFDPIAINGSADTFLGNHQAQSWLVRGVCLGQQQDIRPGRLAGGTIEYVLELTWR